MLKKTFEFKNIQTKGNTLVISGIANSAVVDRVGDFIEPSAWNVENYRKNPVILFNHNQDAIIGRALKIEITENGLEIEAEIGNPDVAELTQLQKDIRSLISQGVLRAFSVGFIPITSEKDGEINRITSAELYEISIVSVPCNADSVVTEVKLKQLIETKEKAMEEQLQKISELLSLLFEKVSYIYDKLQAQEQEQNQAQQQSEENEEMKTLRKRVVELEEVLRKILGE
ncbi:MAG: HK97 family phage prohead protease [Candidatus Bilamarchaeaceae archaeon]